ncbi:uncharacterized protein RCC_10140 [Ramularia collo-cygni]|uniref:Uncharacterized protein n=1 Tax=Ramularia collo-cygni TaxID=112498 RepID=A0A2D3VNE2_9PEZI|nr:uncharacterized protein RCC_10140 [Ramularia collo-cygni]CZT24414.1 uncharacterized protein RCC_10140 [Ramularia collo-cygni]
MSIPPLISHLPEELLLSIFALLDNKPPSITKSRQEPSLELTWSNIHVLKDISSVSRSWRRITLPLLFRFTRSLDDPTKGIKDEKNFLNFVRKNALNVQSVVLSIRKLEEQDRPPPSQDNVNLDVARFWQTLLRVTNASRIVILAPPAELARLTECTIDLSTEWAFEEMDYHLLELRCEIPSSARSTEQTFDAAVRSQSMPPDRSLNRIAANSILMLKPWSHLALNEGSFLRAYSTYEYFERGPPSLVLSIMNCFAARERHAVSWSSLRSFSYTAILPFADHLDFRAILPHLDELDIQLAPDATSNILNDKSRIGRAQMEDCWQELRAAYRLSESFRIM